MTEICRPENLRPGPFSIRLHFWDQFWIVFKIWPFVIFSKRCNSFIMAVARPPPPPPKETNSQSKFMWQNFSITIILLFLWPKWLYLFQCTKCWRIRGPFPDLSMRRICHGCALDETKRNREMANSPQVIHLRDKLWANNNSLDLIMCSCKFWSRFESDNFPKNWLS